MTSTTDTIKMTVQRLAALVVDIATGAKLGTTPPKEMAWHSPPIRYAYSFAHSTQGKAEGTFEFTEAEVNAFVARVAGRQASLGADEFRKRYAHTKGSGWTRGKDAKNTPLPVVGVIKVADAAPKAVKAPKAAAAKGAPAKVPAKARKSA